MSVKSPLRKKIYNQLETQHPKHPGLSPINWAIVFLILFSLVLYTAQTDQKLQAANSNLFWFLNLFVLGAFGLEFMTRLYVVGVDKRFKGWAGLGNYAKSNWFMISIDFLAFAPELFLIAIGINPGGALRALRLLRLLKMAHYFRAFRLVVDAMRFCMYELLAALAVAISLWFVASALLYYAESNVQPDGFGSIARAMWWSLVTLTTIGYGDVYPVTLLGKVMTGIIATIGLGTVALPGAILAGAFIERFGSETELRIDDIDLLQSLDQARY